MIDPARPLFCLPNRVWRVYLGGLLLDRFRNAASPADGHLPEDWLASVTLADNGANRQSPTEGLSRVRLPDGSAGPFLRDVLDPGEPGVLAKFLDAAIRLPVQCHPDRAWARAHLASEHGKTESWHILDVRRDGPEPVLYMGFRPGADPAAFRAAVAAQDIPAILAMLHRFPAVPGDTWLIPGRLPHAIGAGVFLLEVQEPTDWVIQPERQLGDFRLSDENMYGPLDPELALDCFDFAGAADATTIRDRLCLPARPVAGGHARIIGPEHTDCFCLERLACASSAPVPRLAATTVAVVLSGAGALTDGTARWPIVRGDTVVLTTAVPPLQALPDAPLTIALFARGG